MPFTVTPKPQLSKNAMLATLRRACNRSLDTIAAGRISYRNASSAYEAFLSAPTPEIANYLLFLLS